MPVQVAAINARLHDSRRALGQTHQQSQEPAADLDVQTVVVDTGGTARAVSDRGAVPLAVSFLGS